MLAVATRAVRVLFMCCLMTVVAGCLPARSFLGTESPVEAGLNPANLIDAVAQAEADAELNPHALYEIAQRAQTANKPAVIPPKRSILVLSGGGNYGAYTAGVLCGWTDIGTRPQFDVVTGISTGALAAPLAFLGSRYDPQLKEFYTTMKSTDLFRIKKSLRSLLSESLADNAPLAKKVREMVTPELLREIAAEHAKGRRLFIGTTELESRRFIVWDMGEIATRGTPKDAELFCNVLLGSSAIPGFFPPSRIAVNVDGAEYVERHVDGGVSAALFFRPPYVPPERRNDPTAKSLYGSDVYIIVAGKLYADPDVIKPRALQIAGNSVSAVIYSQTRGDLTRLFTISLLTGMNYYMAAIPAEFNAPKSSTDFEPVEMTAMFDEGVRQVRQGTVWRRSPPGVEPGESPLERYGSRLTRVTRTVSGPITNAPMQGMFVPLSPDGIPTSPNPVAK